MNVGTVAEDQIHIIKLVELKSDENRKRKDIALALLACIRFRAAFVPSMMCFLKIK